MEFGYYPGCALHGSSNDYEKSVARLPGGAGRRAPELDDWICCGATAAHSLNHKLAVALPARNLAIAERDGLRRAAGPLPDVLDGAAQGRQALRRRRDAAQARCPRSSS